MYYVRSVATRPAGVVYDVSRDGMPDGAVLLGSDGTPSFFDAKGNQVTARAPWLRAVEKYRAAVPA